MRSLLVWGWDNTHVAPTARVDLLHADVVLAGDESWWCAEGGSSAGSEEECEDRCGQEELHVDGE
jgi:hypothetical protein